MQYFNYSNFFFFFRELETQLLEQCTVDTGAAKEQSLPSVMGKIILIYLRVVYIQLIFFPLHCILTLIFSHHSDVLAPIIRSLLSYC